MADRPRIDSELVKISCVTRRVFFCRCGRGCYHLYSHWSGEFVCRWCARAVNLKPAARRFARIERLRKRLGVGRKPRLVLVDPFPAPIPGPPPWSRARWYRTVNEIVALEMEAFDRLDEERRALERLTQAKRRQMAETTGNPIVRE